MTPELDRLMRWAELIEPGEKIAIVTPEVSAEVRARLDALGYRLVVATTEQIAALPRAERPVIGDRSLAALFGIPVFDGSTVLPTDLIDTKEGA